MPTEHFKDELIGRTWQTAHVVKYGNIPSGVFKTYCGETIDDDPICIGDLDDFSDYCSDCSVFIEREKLPRDQGEDEDDRRTDEVDWPRNTDIDRR